MANPQHVKWFSDGAESWNARRKESSFIPDLEGANLAAEILRPPYPESDSQIPRNSPPSGSSMVPLIIAAWLFKVDGVAFGILKTSYFRAPVTFPQWMGYD